MLAACPPHDRPTIRTPSIPSATLANETGEPLEIAIEMARAVVSCSALEHLGSIQLRRAVLATRLPPERRTLVPGGSIDVAVGECAVLRVSSTNKVWELAVRAGERIALTTATTVDAEVQDALPACRADDWSLFTFESADPSVSPRWDFDGPLRRPLCIEEAIPDGRCLRIPATTKTGIAIQLRFCGPASLWPFHKSCTFGGRHQASLTLWDDTNELTIASPADHPVKTRPIGKACTLDSGYYRGTIVIPSSLVLSTDQQFEATPGTVIELPEKSQVRRIGVHYAFRVIAWPTDIPTQHRFPNLVSYAHWRTRS